MSWPRIPSWLWRAAAAGMIVEFIAWMLGATEPTILGAVVTFGWLSFCAGVLVERRHAENRKRAASEKLARMEKNLRPVHRVST